MFELLYLEIIWDRDYFFNILKNSFIMPEYARTEIVVSPLEYFQFPNFFSSEFLQFCTCPELIYVWKSEWAVVY